MERLAFLAIAIIAALVAARLDLTYVSLAILIGIAIPVVSRVCGRNISNTTLPDYAFVILGLVLLVIAHFVCSQYGISFDVLDQDRSFPKVVRRLPSFGITLLSYGLTSIAISAFQQRQD